MCIILSHHYTRRIFLLENTKGIFIPFLFFLLYFFLISAISLLYLLYLQFAKGITKTTNKVKLLSSASLYSLQWKIH